MVLKRFRKLVHFIYIHLVYILGLDTRVLILGAPFFYINSVVYEPNDSSPYDIYFVQIVVNFGAVKVVHKTDLFLSVNMLLKHQRVKN